MMNRLVTVIKAWWASLDEVVHEAEGMEDYGTWR